MKGRTEADGPDQGALRQEDRRRTLAEVIEGADVFLGLSAGGVLKPARWWRRWRPTR
jgi:malate dehydrogenase (oxaloacetate-decarboxylating)(NADP+)